ncbi:MAG: TusE/DsrC/DsvC family sulfur relay protein [bacterium]
MTYANRTYRIDLAGCLVDSDEWDEGFAEGAASDAKISGSLTDKHWQIISWIRTYYSEYGHCPLVYETCRAHQLRLKDLRELFPSGYQRGACKLAGLTYREGFLGYSPLPSNLDQITPINANTTYLVDVHGFLVNSNDWDKQWAVLKAQEMRMAENLTEQHWKIIDFLRDNFQNDGIVPTVYETCEALGLEIDELEHLFPSGYHRGAVKLAGLRLH